VSSLNRIGASRRKEGGIENETGVQGNTQEKKKELQNRKLEKLSYRRMQIPVCYRGSFEEKGRDGWEERNHRGKGGDHF